MNNTHNYLNVVTAMWVENFSNYCLEVKSQEELAHSSVTLTFSFKMFFLFLISLQSSPSSGSVGSSPALQSNPNPLQVSAILTFNP